MEWKVSLCIVFVLIVTTRGWIRTIQNDVAHGKDNINNEGDLTTEPNKSDENITTEEPEMFVVQTTHGDVLGDILHPFPIRSFIDIPYGKFDQLFQAPTDPEPWLYIHNATDHEKLCPQLQGDEVVGDTDCLVLSVFTPLEIEDKASVLFHIHEGNFASGSGDFHIYGPEYLVSEGLILVLPNYRLGPFGFLCLRDEVAPGNAALKDLTLALEWVNNNIGAFGGDPEKITVSADGTAGALVGMLALSPVSSGLFSRAITESGSVLAPWLLDRDPVTTGLKLVQSLSEDSKENENTSILQDVNFETILKAVSRESLEFKPCVDKDNQTFLERTPWAILNSSDFNANITFMIGSANKAGMFQALEHDDESLAKLNENIERLIPTDLAFNNNSIAKRNAANRIKTQYFDGNNITKDTLNELSLFYTDSAYLGPSVRLARPLAEAGNVLYVYEFTFDGELNREKIAINGCIPGAARGDIIGYVFVQDGYIPEENSDEAHVAKLMTDLWVSFITTGEPTAEEVTWSQFKSENETLLIIGTQVELESGVHPDRMALWTDLYDKHFVELNAAHAAVAGHAILVSQILILIRLLISY